jgi:hypothetical protein
LRSRDVACIAHAKYLVMDGRCRVDD